MHRILPRLLLATLVLLPHSGCAQDGAAGDDVVRPRFRWTAGSSARVVIERMDFQKEPPAADTVRSQSRHTLRVERHPDGMRVGFADGDSVAEWMVVTRRGKLLRTEDAGASVVLDDSLGLGGRVWTLLVERWAGREIAIGEIQEEQAMLPSPLGAGGPVRTTIEWAAEGRVPCREGVREARCIRFRVRSAADHVDMARSYRALLAARGTSAAALAAMDPLVVYAGTTYVVTEEGTLRPHLVDSDHFLTIQEGGRDVTAVKREVTRFTWDR